MKVATSYKIPFWRYRKHLDDWEYFSSPINPQILNVWYITFYVHPKLPKCRCLYIFYTPYIEWLGSFCNKTIHRAASTVGGFTSLQRSVFETLTATRLTMKVRAIGKDYPQGSTVTGVKGWLVYTVHGHKSKGNSGVNSIGIGFMYFLSAVLFPIFWFLIHLHPFVLGMIFNFTTLFT